MSLSLSADVSTSWRPWRPVTSAHRLSSPTSIVLWRHTYWPTFHRPRDLEHGSAGRRHRWPTNDVTVFADVAVTHVRYYN